VADWDATPSPKACHACGSHAVTPSNDPKYNWRAQFEPEPPLEAPTPTIPSEDIQHGNNGEHDENGDEDVAEEGPVAVPDDIQVDTRGKPVVPTAAKKPTRKRRR
jgi:hypothetical protein